ncbi:MAG: phenylalanine--tRNA ligase subunit beta, partial [Vulcanimicrobiaceae bacterium]
MKLPIVWLRDYLDLTPTTDELVERLAALGFPVAGIERRPRVSGVVAGRIVKLDRHPNADRLQICTVDVRGPALLSIATGATNVAAGQIVPVATLGAHLLDLQGRPLRIEPRQMRGFESQGMLASAAEFGFEGEWFEDGIMQLDATTALGTDVVALFGLNDPVLDVEVTSNRVDAMCVVGIARELAASYGIGLREPRTTLDVATDSLTPTSADLRVTLESPDCPHFVAQRFSNLTVRP